MLLEMVLKFNLSIYGLMKTLMRSTKLHLITEPTNFCGVMGCALIQKSAMQHQAI
jgi:hypothetical protein